MKNLSGYKSLENNVNALKEIARKLGKRTSSLNLIDPQVVRSSWDWRDALSDKPTPPDFFTRKLSFKTNGYQVTLRVNDEFLAADVTGAFGDSVICSFVNNRIYESTRILAAKSLSKAFGCKIHIPSSNAESTLSFLLNPSFQDLVRAFNFSQRESLHIGDGYAHLYIQRFISDDVLQALDILYELLALLPSAEETIINLEELPEAFHQLIPWIKQWGITDDNERSEKMSKASSNTLLRLVKFVEPEFNSINAYLDSFQNKPLTEQAILLGALAEGASEAKLLLKRRISEKEKA